MFIAFHRVFKGFTVQLVAMDIVLS